VRVTLEELHVECIVGILPHERTTPQRLTVKCVVDYDYREGLFVDYALLAHRIETLLIDRQFGLLEEAIAALFVSIPQHFSNIQKIELTLSKPDILDNGIASVSDSLTML